MTKQNEPIFINLIFVILRRKNKKDPPVNSSFEPLLYMHRFCFLQNLVGGKLILFNIIQDLNIQGPA